MPLYKYWSKWLPLIIIFSTYLLDWKGENCFFIFWKMLFFIFFMNNIILILLKYDEKRTKKIELLEIRLIKFISRLPFTSIKFCCELWVKLWIEYIINKSILYSIVLDHVCKRVLTIRSFKDFLYLFIIAEEVSFKDTKEVSFKDTKEVSFKDIEKVSFKDIKSNIFKYYQRILAIRSFKDFLYFLTGETTFKDLLKVFLGLK